MECLLELPEECLLSILGWLPLPGLIACCGVSRELYRLARDPSLWRGLFIESKKMEGAPDARLWCSSVVFQNKLYVYGGHTTQGVLSNLISNVKSDLYCQDLNTKKWAQIQHSMGGKTEHKCVVHDGKLWFVGGYNGYDYTSELHAFDPETNTAALVETTGEVFSRRSALTALVYKDKLYTFGGWNGFTRTWFNDVHVFSFETKTWRAVTAQGNPPLKRTSHSAVIHGNKMYVFGGFSGEEYLNDMHEFDLDTETWSELTPFCKGDVPSPRSRFCAAVHGDCMYILGGWNKVGYFNDFYVFNFATRVWSSISNWNFKVPSIIQYSLAASEEFLYIFGGFCAREKTCINSLYIYSLGMSNQSS
jgi:N-acetylneuraminic acid mutarotase